MGFQEDAKSLPGLKVYPLSVVQVGGTTYRLIKVPDGTGKLLSVHGNMDGLDGTYHEPSGTWLCSLSAGNAATLRDRLPWLRPAPLGLATSAGCGDRLGLATPGHIRAVRRVGGIAPVLAQQSMRENARTGRSPQQVMDDALWGVFQEGWREPWGADADHLKTTGDIDACVAAGYTFFTVDPGDHVDNSAHTAPLKTLQEKIQALPWHELEDSPDGLRHRYLGGRFPVEDFVLIFDEETLLRAAAKYGRAIHHTAMMYRHLAGQTETFELEMSVDETGTPTSAEEHYFIASELKRLGVQWVSLAPRYVGRFEKGVDYIGDLDTFRIGLSKHAAIARALGPYKLSIHSGSDKFSIYPIIAELTEGLLHLKTAGTSYLEALRALARVVPSTFREIMEYARERYPQDRVTYHVSAELDRVPALDSIPDDGLESLLDQFDARQVLHVTFGSVLDRFGSALLMTLEQHEEVYCAMLESHFERHLAPLIG